MVRSMTGFGRCEVANEDIKITVEMKSVNNRYFDTNIRLPKKFNAFESVVRNLLKNYAIRGKIDIFITYEDLRGTESALKYNETLAAEYVEYSRKMAEQFGIHNDYNVSSLMRAPEVLTMEEEVVDEDMILEVLTEAVKGAGEKFVLARETEGENLKSDILDKLTVLAETVDKIALESPRIIEEYKNKLTEKVNDLLGDNQIDNTRIAMEVTLFADKLCVDEEMVRLKSHIQNMTNLLIKGGELGKQLDFLTQEMNRESNTILSKANDLNVTNLGILLKTTVEKIREQIQNIE